MMGNGGDCRNVSQGPIESRRTGFGSALSSWMAATRPTVLLNIINVNEREMDLIFQCIAISRDRKRTEQKRENQNGG